MRFCLEPVNVSFKYVNNNQDYNIQQQQKNYVPFLIGMVFRK